MTDRKYTLAEIDRMRNAINWMYPDGVAFYQDERARETEERLRTYMAAGIEPEDLERQMGEYIRARQEAQARMERIYDPQAKK